MDRAPMSRRSFTTACLTALAAAASPAARAVGAAADEIRPHLSLSDWERFRARFLQPDGRVVDTGNGGISHSEGQGYGMLLAVAFEDAGAFLDLWGWTRRTLQIRDDALLAWKWSAAAGVEDDNNASDGDLLVAWALLRAYARWDEPAWREAAFTILRDLAATCVVEKGPSRLLLPGARGFEREDRIVINPSYWVYPALADLARVGAPGPWKELAGTGEALIQAFGDIGYGLAPDWCAVGETTGPAEGFAFTFGFDAIRVPLYYAWSAPRERAERLLKPYAEYARRFGAVTRIPAVFDLATGETSDYPLSRGGQAVFRLVDHAVAEAPPALPEGGDDLDYYASILLLLTKLAATEMQS